MMRLLEMRVLARSNPGGMQLTTEPGVNPILLQAVQECCRMSIYMLLSWTHILNNSKYTIL
jgi:hypothetical protein